MKKAIKLLATLIATIILLTSCGAGTGTGTGSGGGTGNGEINVDNVLRLLGELSDNKPDGVTLAVIATKNELTLTSVYEISETSVEYRVERYSVLDLGSEELPEEEKTVLEGIATIENGSITAIDGDPVELPEYTDLSGGFGFASENLENVKAEKGKLTATVKSLYAFLGIAADQSVGSTPGSSPGSSTGLGTGSSSVPTVSASLTVTYNAASLESLELTYVKDGITLTLTYTFIKD